MYIYIYIVLFIFFTASRPYPILDIFIIVYETTLARPTFTESITRHTVSSASVRLETITLSCRIVSCHVKHKCNPGTRVLLSLPNENAFGCGNISRFGAISCRGHNIIGDEKNRRTNSKNICGGTSRKRCNNNIITTKKCYVSTKYTMIIL